MKLNRLFVLAVIVVSCFNGCGSSSDKSSQVKGITFVSKGPVVQKPVVSTVHIDSQSINRTDSPPGQPASSWSRQIQFADYTSMQRIVTRYNLMECDDVTLPPGSPVCVGDGGMSITIAASNKVHSFDISGDVMCDRSLWPEGVRNLVSLEAALLTKYASAQEQTFDTLQKGQVPPGGKLTQQLAVIRNDADWASFWNLLYASHSPIPALPPVNFTEKVIVAVVDSERPTGGYSVAITGLKPTASGVTVSALQLSPGRSCMVTTAFTLPFHIVTTQPFSGTARLEFSESITDCGP